LLDRRAAAPRVGRLSLALVLAAAPAFADPALVAGPDPGPDRASAGRPLLDEIFPEGLPYPFETVLARLRTLAGESNVETALIPLGRSLQRYAASPEYFASPRIVVAVTGDRSAGPADPRLADRLFLGYQPAAEVVEAISYNAEAGRFEFQEIVGYTAPGATPEPAERAVCTACHQGQGPIFPRPLWTETNADPTVATRLAALGDSFYGAPVSQTVDALDAFDAATDRAARVALANRLWAEACPDASCRAALLVAAIRLGLTGTQTYASAVRSAFDADHAHWPEGLATISPDLPNRDPLLDGATDNPEATGALDPETPRPAVPLWRPGPGSFSAAAEAIAAQLSPGDFAWIDARLRHLEADATTISLPCTLTPAAGPSGGAETRFRCENGGTRLEGHFSPDRPGRLALVLPNLPRQPDIRLDPGGQPSGRTADGRRVAALSFADGEARLAIANDLGLLEAGLATRSTAASRALAPGPFPRAAVLALIETLTGATDG
jgi:hypothetical protein